MQQQQQQLPGKPARTKKPFITNLGRRVPRGHKGVVTSRQLALASGDELWWFVSPRLSAWVPVSILEITE